MFLYEFYLLTVNAHVSGSRGFLQRFQLTTVCWTVEDHGGDDGHSMARCTGLVTVCCVEEWIADPQMIPIGVHPPEILSTEAVARVLNRMSDYGIVIDGPNFTSNDHRK